MDTYDPNSESTPISFVEEIPPPEEAKPSVPTGLLRPEKKVDQDQMADFSSPIEEVMPGPGQMMQNEIMGPPSPIIAGPSARVSTKKKSSSSQKQGPFGLTEEQFTALVAGISAVVAFSEPVQGKLSTMVPKFLSESGKHTMTGMAVTALVAAIVFYFAKQFLKDRV